MRCLPASSVVWESLISWGALLIGSPGASPSLKSSNPGCCIAWQSPLCQGLLFSSTPLSPLQTHIQDLLCKVAEEAHGNWARGFLSAEASSLQHISLQVKSHCSQVGPHLGTLVPMGTKMRFLVPIWSPFCFKVPIFPISDLRTRQKSVQPLSID